MDTAMDTDSVTESNNIVCFSSSGVNSVTPEWNAFESDIIELLSGVKPASLENSAKKTVVKSGGSKTVKKATTLNVVVTKPIPEMKLYAFPSFDKSKSMIYFASTYARLLNSGELDELGRMIRSYCSKDCPVKLHETLVVSTAQYVDLLSIANIFHPDSMCCMHSTKVIDNTIRSVLYFKYTDVPDMYKYADTVVTDPAYKWVYVGKRKTILRRNLQLDKQPEETQRQIYELLDKNESIQVYGKVVLTLTCDHFTKKIAHVDYDSVYTSISYKNEHIMLNELDPLASL